MTQGVKDLVNAIASGDSVAIETAFNTEMASRISAKIDDMRTEVAKNMFNEACGSKKKMKEDISEEELTDLMLGEALGKNEPASAWIKDFVSSDDPKFAGKSAAKRKQMALAAYYAKQRNEEIDVTELLDYLNENEEVLTELSKDTLKSYVKSASQDLPRLGNTLGRLQIHGKLPNVEKNVSKTITNRYNGINKATDKLAK